MPLAQTDNSVLEHLPDHDNASERYVMPSSGERFCGADDALCHGSLETPVPPEAFPNALSETLSAPDRVALGRAKRERFDRGALKARIFEAFTK